MNSLIASNFGKHMEKRMKSFQIVSITAVFLIVCACNSAENVSPKSTSSAPTNSETSSSSAVSEAPAVIGKWKNASCVANDDTVYAYSTSEIEFAADGKFLTTSFNFSDSECKAPVSTVVVTELYKLGQGSSKAAGMFEVEVEPFIKHSVTPATQEFAEKLNREYRAKPAACSSLKFEQGKSTDIGACLTILLGNNSATGYRISLQVEGDTLQFNDQKTFTKVD
jgi:hypothetical protein